MAYPWRVGTITPDTNTTAWLYCHASTAGGKSYRLMWDSPEAGKYYSVQLNWREDMAGGGECNSLGTMDVVYPVDGTETTTKTLTGTGWSTTARAEAFGGTYSRTLVAGESFTMTTDANATDIILYFPAAADGGFAKVTIDGDATAATSLLTATQWVASGKMAASCLVANGGTLNPTDRILNCYSPSTKWAASSVILAGAAPAAREVIATATGYKQVASSDPLPGAKLYISGMLYGAPVAMPTPGATPAAAGVVFVPAGILHDFLDGDISVYEPTRRVAVSSTGTQHWLGNNHGYEIQTALTLTIGATPVTLSLGEMVSGVTATVVRTSSLYHPDVDAGATAVCGVVQTYALDGTGLLVTGVETWAAEMYIAAAYGVNWPLDGAFDYAVNPEYSHVPRTVRANGDPAVVQMLTKESDFLIAWQTGGHYAAALSVGTGTAYNTPAAGGLTLFMQDRSEALHKIYAQDTSRAASTTAVDEVFTYNARLMTYYYADALPEAWPLPDMGTLSTDRVPLGLRLTL